MKEANWQPVDVVADRLADEAATRRRERMERLGLTPREPKLPRHKIIVALAKARARAARVMGVLVLSGCTAFEPAPESAMCSPCIGPYDLGLASHREALGLNP